MHEALPSLHKLANRIGTLYCSVDVGVAPLMLLFTLDSMYRYIFGLYHLLLSATRPGPMVRYASSRSQSGVEVKLGNSIACLSYHDVGSNSGAVSHSI